MKEIKIYLKYPWKFPDSPYYNSLLNCPPKGIEFVEINKDKSVITNAVKFKFLQKLKNLIKDTPQRFGITIVNAHKVKTNEKYELIHAAHCLIKDSETPWVADLEMEGSFLISGIHNKNWPKKVKKYLEDSNCKKILPWTKSMEIKILDKFPQIKKKVEVVYPAIPQRTRKRKQMKTPVVIYSARAFNLKGGLLALEVMNRLKKKYNIRCIVISDVPEKLKKKYSEVEIYKLMPQEKLFELMSIADVFLYPSQMDTFGFAILEAMSFGVPTVALNTPLTNSIDEIIENEKTGFLIDYQNPKGFLKEISEEEEEIIEKLCSKCKSLCNDKLLKKQMSKNCLKEIKNGKFSIEKRNKKLFQIYSEALK